MKKLNCIVIDDSIDSINITTQYLKKIEFCHVLKTFNDPFEAINYLESNEVDLVFLDIMMGELSGIDVIESLVDPPYFIFITSYDTYALKAFEMQAVDYIQKPVKFKRLMQAVNKAYQLKYQKSNVHVPGESDTNDVQKGNDSEKGFTFIKTKYKMQKLLFDDILHIKGLNNYLIVKTIKDTLYTIKSFNEILSILPSYNFVRIHKSYIVAINKIEVIGKNHVEIDGQNIPIGESYKEYFFNFLKVWRYYKN